MNQDILIGFVLDKSASMSGVTKATVDGFNSFIDAQREAPGTALLSLTIFDHTLDVRYIAKPLALVPKMTNGRDTGNNAYVIGGNTALFDAVGITVKAIENWLVANPTFDGQIKIVTLTDGQNNASRSWHVNAGGVKDGDPNDLLGLIQWKQRDGWEFVFLGAGGSTWLERTFSPVANPDAFYAMANTDHGHNHAYTSITNSVLRSRAGGQSMASSFAVDPNNVRVNPDGDPAADLIKTLTTPNP